VAKLICAFTEFALLEDRSRSWLVKFDFDAMRPRATKRSFAFIVQIQ